MHFRRMHKLCSTASPACAVLSASQKVLHSCVAVSSHTNDSKRSGDAGRAQATTLLPGSNQANPACQLALLVARHLSGGSVALHSQQTRDSIPTSYSAALLSKVLLTKVRHTKHTCNACQAWNVVLAAGCGTMPLRNVS